MVPRRRGVSEGKVVNAMAWGAAWLRLCTHNGVYVLALDAGVFLNRYKGVLNCVQHVLIRIWGALLI